MATRLAACATTAAVIAVGAVALASGQASPASARMVRPGGGQIHRQRPAPRDASINAIWDWGYNHYGDLGTGTTAYQTSTPVQAIGLSGITGIAAGGSYWLGGDHALAVRQDGTVWAWGNNTDGELGHARGAAGDQTDGNGNYWNDVPVQVSGLPAVAAVAAGQGYSVALGQDGTVWAWGDNSQRELGHQSGTDGDVPYVAGDAGDGWFNATAVQVAYLNGVTAIAAGSLCCLTLRQDGTVWGFGDGGYGQLGSGNNLLPGNGQVLQVSGISGVTAIAAGDNYSLALTQDGTVWAWGFNDSGQLGSGGTETADENPGQVSGLSGITAIAAGYAQGLALRQDGTVWVWGYGAWGGLGNGTQTNSNVPIQVAGLSGVAAIAAGDNFDVVLLEDGTLWAWGMNELGQLGHSPGTDGDVSGSFEWNGIPRQVAGLSGVTTIAAGNDSVMAVRPVATSVSGSVSLYGATDQQQQVDFTFHGSGGTFTFADVLNADGSYLIPVPADTYNIGVNGSKWLRTTLSGVVASGNVAGLNATLLPGDLNGDNVIDMSDFSPFAEAFGSSSGASNWNPAADLNCDGVVDIQDFSLFAQDFGLTGDPAP
jgi:alpha-tubulin suppressor-like RCC1 family protein